MDGSNPRRFLGSLKKIICCWIAIKQKPWINTENRVIGKFRRISNQKTTSVIPRETLIKVGEEMGPETKRKAGRNWSSSSAPQPPPPSPTVPWSPSPKEALQGEEEISSGEIHRIGGRGEGSSSGIWRGKNNPASAVGEEEEEGPKSHNGRGFEA